jgi:hypothetical protein
LKEIETIINKIFLCLVLQGDGHNLVTSVAEQHHFDAAPAPGKNFDAAPAPTLLCSMPTFF